jgi:hypothetical protein
VYRLPQKEITPFSQCGALVCLKGYMDFFLYQRFLLCFKKHETVSLVNALYMSGNFLFTDDGNRPDLKRAIGFASMAGVPAKTKNY